MDEPRNNDGGGDRPYRPRGDGFRDREGGGDDDRRGGRGGGGFRRRFASRRKVCPFCVDKVDYIDYKHSDMLGRFLTDRGKIKARRKLGTCAKHQRRLAVAIKRARHLALLPFSHEQTR